MLALWPFDESRPAVFLKLQNEVLFFALLIPNHVVRARTPLNVVSVDTCFRPMVACAFAFGSISKEGGLVKVYPLPRSLPRCYH